MRERDIFIEALQIAPASRSTFVDKACDGDGNLQERVHSLLNLHSEARSFLEPAIVPTILQQPVLEGVGTQIGPYKLREVLGEGGFGLVYVAEQEQPLRRKVALKVIKPGMDSKEVIARFEAERQALALMDHPNIAKVHDAGTSETGRPYFVMELVRGLPITDYCDQAKLPLRDRLKLFITVCQAVQHAHQKGIIHRDLKPSNVMVTLHDGVPVPKVIDFGVAKALNQRLTEHSLCTRHAQMLGTPMYMSPEQAELSGLDVDTRSDVYSLGVLLYELLTGHTPFDKETLQKAGFDELRRMIREVEPSRPSQRISTLAQQYLSTVASRRGIDERQLSRSLRGELDWIVMKALEKDRTRRYGSADALAADLQRFLNDEPIQARPPSNLYVLRKFVGRNRARVIAGGLITASLLVLIGAKLRNDARRRELHGSVEISLSAARAATEANDLDLAAQHAAVAEGRLTGYADAFPELAAAVAQVRGAAEQRPEDVRRMQEFERRTRKAMEDMFSGGTERVADQDAVEALQLYGILDDDAWITKLRQSQLTEQEQTSVRQTAYETLLVLADNGYRWREKRTEERVRSSLEYLRRAALIREPTRAFYWVRADCFNYLKDTDRAEQDRERFRNTPAETAFDYFLPGHTAGWHGDIDEAMRSYESALRIEPDHFNSLFFLAMRLSADDRDAEAAQLYRACVALRPDHCPSLRNRAGILVELPDAAAHHAEALELSSKAIALRPDKVADDYAIRAVVYHAMGDRESALVDAEHAVRVDPRSLNARLACMSVLIDLGRVDEALEHGQKGVEIAPDDDRAINSFAVILSRAGRREEAIALLQRGVEVHPEDRQLHTNLGGELFAAGRLDEALAACQRALELEPKVAARHYDISCALDALGRSDDAIAALRQALAIDPDYAEALNNLGFVLRKQGRFAEAVEVLKKAIELDPDARNPHLNLADVLGRQQRWDAALAEWRQVVKIDPDFAPGYCGIGACLMEQQKLTEAIAAFSEAIRHDPENLAAHGNRAIVLAQQREYAEAIAAHERCLAIAPDNPMVCNNLAWIYCMCPNLSWRDADKALNLAARATELDLKAAGYWSTLGTAQYRHGDWSASITSLMKAKELEHSQQAFDDFVLAMSHWQSGRQDEARKWYDKAIAWMQANAPDNEDLMSLRAEAEVLLGIDASPVAPTEPPVSERRSLKTEKPVHGPDEN